MIVSFTLVRYPRRYIPFALLGMAVHRLPMFLNKKCSFWKLLGSGRNGSFDLNPDWQQWGLLATWNTSENFEDWKKNSFITRWWDFFKAEQWTVLCKPLSGHGMWDGCSPFVYVDNGKEYTGPIAVLTRATIRRHRLKNFWNHVDPVASVMADAPGLITSFGVGEAPVYKQATFSIWESTKAMQDFAYHSPEHKEVIMKTRVEGWYSEQLFARFKPIASSGALNGKNPFNF